MTPYKKNRRYFSLVLLIVFLLNISHITYAQSWSLEGKTKKAYDHVLGLKITKARELLAVNENTNDFGTIYVNNLADVVELMVTEDESLFQDYEDKSEIRLGKLRNSIEVNPYKLFYEAEIKLQWAFIYLKFGKEFNAAWNIRQAYKLISRNMELYPEFLPNYKSMGILHVMIGSVPSQYNWILGLLGLKGSVNEGLTELSLLSESSSPFKLEAFILLNLVRSYILQENESAVESLDQVYRKNHNILLLRYIYASVLMKNSRSEYALKILNQPIPEECIDFYFMDYMKGEIYLQKQAYRLSEASYERFIANYKGHNFIKDAYYKLSLTQWLQGNKKQAKEHFNLARIIGVKQSEADKYAASQLAKEKFPDKNILKIRLSTDGGYYEDAIAMIDKLKNHQFSNDQDKTEFIYRKARLYHKTNQMNKAIPLYIKTIEQSGDNKWYYAPNSALQLGYIYRELKLPETARNYFLKALDYKGHEYENSIENKAKSALSSLGDTP